jgi:hypothetical protein
LERGAIRKSNPTKRSPKKKSRLIFPIDNPAMYKKGMMVRRSNNPLLRLCGAIRRKVTPMRMRRGQSDSQLLRT